MACLNMQKMWLNCPISRNIQLQNLQKYKRMSRFSVRERTYINDVRRFSTIFIVYHRPKVFTMF